MKRKISFLLGLFLLVFTLAGCDWIIPQTSQQTSTTNATNVTTSSTEGVNTTSTETFVVTFFNDDGITILGIVEVLSGHAAIPPANPYKLSTAEFTYLFTGWDKAFSNVTSHMSVYAQYQATPRVYQIQFEVNGGTEVTNLSIAYGEPLVITAEPTRFGRVFMGWYLDEDCQEPLSLSTMPANDLILYAKWEYTEAIINVFSDLDEVYRNYYYIASSDSIDIMRETMSFYYPAIDAADTMEYVMALYEECVYELSTQFIIDYHKVDFEYSKANDINIMAKVIELLVQISEWHTLDFTGVYDFYSLKLINAVSPEESESEFQNFIAEINGLIISQGNLSQDFITTFKITTIAVLQNYRDQVNAIGESVDDVPVTDSEMTLFLAQINASSDISNILDLVVLGMRGMSATLFVASKSYYLDSLSDLYAIKLLTVDPLYLTELEDEYARTLSDIEDSHYYETVFERSTTFMIFANNLPDKETILTSRIVFNSNGGSQVDDLVSIEGAPIAPPSDPILESYLFTGWYTDIELSTLYIFTIMPEEDVLLYAGWELIPDEPTDVLFSLKDDLTYEVVGYTGQGPDLVIPSRHLGYWVTSIHSNAFDESSVLLSVTIPASIITIELNAFFLNPNLTTFIVSEENPNYASLNGVLYNKDFTTLIKYPSANTELTFVIPTSVEVISDYAFFSNPYLTRIIFGTSVREVPISTAFWGTSNLENLDVDLGNLSYSSIDGVLFNFEQTVLIRFPEGRRLGNYIVPEGVTEIGSNAFTNCVWLEAVVLPSTLIKIGSGAFQLCPFTEIIIPLNVTEIGSSAFNECTALSIYAWASTQPEGWNELWKDPLTIVYWGYTNLPSQVTLTFVTNGGSPINPLTNYPYTEVVVPNPIREGYTFDGWYEESALLNYFGNSVLFMPQTTMTLYAAWSINQYWVEFDPCGGTTIVGFYGDYGMTFDNPITTKTGYIFDGWYLDQEYTQYFGMMITAIQSSNHYLYAKWVLATFTISFETNGGSQMDPITDEYGTQLFVTNPVKLGYHFEGWYRDIGLTDFYGFDVNYMEASSLTLYAMWSANQYSVEFDSNGGTWIEGIYAPYQTVFENPTTTREGYTFAGWYKDYEFTDYFGMTVTSIPLYSVYLIAKWDINTYTVTFESNGGQIINPITDVYGTEFQIDEPYKEGYTFDGWYLDAQLLEYYNYTVNYIPSRDITYYAKWTVNEYTLQFNTNGGSEIAIITEPYGTIIDNLITTRTGYDFVGWYRDAELTLYFADTLTTVPSLNLYLHAKWIPNISRATMDGFTYIDEGDHYVISKYIGTNTIVEVPRYYYPDTASYEDRKPVTIINDDGCFWGTTVVQVTIPNTITYIGNYAFAHTAALTTVTFEPGSTITQISEGIFWEATALTNFIIPSTVLVIEAGAFYATYDLTSISIPKEVTLIAGLAFKNATSLNAVTFESDTHLLVIEEQAFWGTMIESFIMPNSVHTIGAWLFYDCLNLVSIQLSSSLHNIGTGAFYNCESLSSLTVDALNPYYTSIDNVLFNIDLSKIVQYAQAKEGTTFVIPSSVTIIGAYAFNNCDGLISISIPSSVTTIEWAGFVACTNMISIYIPLSVTAIDQYTFSACTSLTIYASAPSKPAGWLSVWNEYGRPVVWNYVE